jgi:hypothetical protein
MSEPSEFVIDFFAEGETSDEYRVVLVEDGPWPKPCTPRLIRLQDRLYLCIDAAIDGAIANRFPQCKGKHITIQVDCYNAPREEVEAFFYKFSESVFCIEDYREGLERSKFVSGIGFSISFDSIN